MIGFRRLSLLVRVSDVLGVSLSYDLDDYVGDSTLFLNLSTVPSYLTRLINSSSS